jgi:hypothetical protein
MLKEVKRKKHLCDGVWGDETIIEGTCEDCRYWVDIGVEDAGECHREPPRLTRVENGELWGVWPRTQSLEVCGEWRQSNKLSVV